MDTIFFAFLLVENSGGAISILNSPIPNDTIMGCTGELIQIENKINETRKVIMGFCVEVFASRGA